MSSSTRTSSGGAPPDPRWLVGRLSEQRELSGLLAERPGLIVVEADPLSGATGVLAHVVDQLDYPAVLVDARGMADAMDLALRLADAAIETLAPAAAGWWRDGGPPRDSGGLTLARALHDGGIRADRLQHGDGAALDRLRDALRLVALLADGDVLVALDHLDALLESLGRSAAVELLAVLRAARQAPDAPDLLLVGRPRGPLSRGLRDRDHPLYRAGQPVAVRRPDPRRFGDELALTGQRGDARLVGAAAELAAGAPGYVWRIIELAPERAGEPAWARAAAAWSRLRELAAPQTAAQFELLGAAHRLAPALVAAIASRTPPYALAANDKSVRDALERLRARGVLWAPQPRSWAVADPLLAAWAREHAPTRAGRRA